MKPILIHIHIFYPDLWPELKTCVMNVQRYPSELFVTMVENHKEIISDIKEIFPKAHIKIVENRGYDVGPFIHILNQVNLDEYSYVVKLHTKRDLSFGSLLNDYNVSGNLWRKYALSFTTEQNFEKVLTAFQNDSSLGMVGNYHLIINKETNDPLAVIEANRLLDSISFIAPEIRYVAGTIFIARSQLLQPIKKLELTLSDFEVPNREHKTSLAHALERFFGMLVLSQNYTVKDVYTKQEVQNRDCRLMPLRKIWHFIYRSKVNKKGKLRAKFCKIPIPTFIILKDYKK